MKTITYYLFNLALLPLYPAFGLYLLYRRFVQHKSAASVAGLMGRIPQESVNRLEGRRGSRIWFHAVSVGETVACRPILQALREADPSCVIALSNTTDGGHTAAQTLLKAGDVDALFFFPLDLPAPDKRVLNAIQPDAILFMETELWPNLLHLAQARGVKTLLVNGRVSDNLLKSAPRLGPVWKWITSNLDGFLMRDAGDAERAKELGIPDNRIKVTGDVKLESPAVPAAQLRESWRRELGLKDELLWVAGSTHPGEEQMILTAYKALLVTFPSLALVVAPRHLDRLDEVLECIAESNLEASRRSQGGHAEAGKVFVLDTVGELADCYAAAEVAFVGGSLIERGGHNVLEPVLRGAPVLFGPHVMNFRAAAKLVVDAGLGEKLVDEGGLVPAMSRWLRDEAARKEILDRVEAQLGRHRGAAARTAAEVVKVIREGSLF